jgi:hypothetical protein
LGLSYETRGPERDVHGHTLVPSSPVLVLDTHTIDSAAATVWLGTYGLMEGWFHGVLFPSANGGATGASFSALAGVGGAAIGAAAGSAYAFLRADNLQAAHTVVQFGTLGTLGGWGAGILSGQPPSSTVNSVNLSLLGTLAGTAVGIAYAETQPPTPGALTLGLTVGFDAFVSATALTAGYRYSGNFALGSGLLVGALAGTATTLATSSLDIGLFPIAGALGGSLVGAGVAAVPFFFVEGSRPTEASGWGVLAGTVGGAALGGGLALLLPSNMDPFLRGTLLLHPPVIAAIPDVVHPGQVLPVAMVSGTF